MSDFAYEEILLLFELVIKEERKIMKQIEPDIWRLPLKIFRPGLFRRLSRLVEIEHKLDVLGASLRKDDE